MSRKKTKKSAAGQAKTIVTVKSPEDVLDDLPTYKLYKNFVKFSLIGCMLCIAASLVLRINFEGFDKVSLFLSLLAYLLVGSVIFIWLVRLRPMKKKAKLAAQGSIEQDSSELLAERIGKPTASLADEPLKATLPQSPEYLRYRLIWRILLVAAGALIVAASIALRMFEGLAGLALTLQVMALLPVAAALYLYRTQLRPLKQEWENRNPGAKK